MCICLKFCKEEIFCLVHNITFQSVEEGMVRAKNYTHPLLLITGSLDNILSAVVICDRKVVTGGLPKSLFQSVLVLIGIYFLYHLEYPDNIRSLLNFLQEKLFNIPWKGCASVVYNNFYRTFSCMEQKVREISDIEATQGEWLGSDED